MHHKYANRKDIAILMIEKNLSPSGAGISEHDLSGTGFFLDGYGFTVDMIWSIRDHVFTDFEAFKEETIRIRDSRYANIEDTALKRIFESDLPDYRLLRESPIKNLDDLSKYRMIIAHPDNDNAGILLDFVKKYPGIPVICPYEASSMGTIPSEEDVTRNVDRDIHGIYIVRDEDFSHGTIRLIEYLLDKNKA